MLWELFICLEYAAHAPAAYSLLSETTDVHLNCFGLVYFLESSLKKAEEA